MGRLGLTTLALQAPPIRRVLRTWNFPGEYLAYFVDEKIRENVGALNFDFDRDPATLASLAKNLRRHLGKPISGAFSARGGKILLWHGWADGAIMATSSIGYYEGVMKAMGSRKRTEDFFRLFLVPGVHHGGVPWGSREFDSMTALENWVEKGEAPRN